MKSSNYGFKFGVCVSLLITQFSSIMSIMNSYTQEYCLRTNSEFFEATCMTKEVIVMSQAIYGRMKMGKCLEEERKYLETLGNDPNIIGCSIDILTFMDQRCSGRNRCEIRGADHELLQLNPCHAIFKSYLEASYECAPVVEEDRTCTVRVATETQNIVLSSSASERRCGSRHQPWRLEAPEGQQISVNLLDFLHNTRAGDCQPLGYLLEELTSANISICSEPGRRISRIFSSQSNILKLTLLDQSSSKRYEEASYLIQITAIGCSNVIPPADAWLRRDGNTAVVGCYTSRQSWTLSCVDSQWIGVIGNCTLDARIESSVEKTESMISIDSNSSIAIEVVVITTIVIAGLLICVIILCAGAVCWKRYNVQCKTYNTYNCQNPHLTNHCGTKNQQPLLSAS